MEEKKKSKFLSKTLRTVIVIVVLVAAVFIALNEFYIDILWYGEVGYLEVFFKALTTKLKLGIPLFLFFAVVLSIYFKLLTLSGGKPEAKVVNKEGKKSFIRGKLPYIISCIIAAVMSFLTTSNLWYKILEFANSVAFGKTDPVFGKDISFYVFKLPLLQSLIGIILLLLAILFAATFIYTLLIISQKGRIEHNASEGNSFNLNMNAKGTFSRMWSSFRVQLSVFSALLLLLAGFWFYLQRFALMYSTNGIVYGASYTDIHITLPVYTVVAVLCVLAAIATFIFGLAGKLKPVIILYVVVVGVYFAGMGVGLAIESFIVSPNEYSKEAEYISYNIQNTQAAYGLDNIETKTFKVENDITAEDIMDNEITINNVPINDYVPTLDTFNSLQAIRTYYEFVDVDVDRYYLDGDYTQVFLAAREMNTQKLNADAQTWINQSLKYTHGFGVTVSPVNTTTNSGQPDMIAKDIPPQSEYDSLQVIQPRIYFGEDTKSYAVVNTKAKEFDYPSGSDNVENVYDGTAGIPMSFLNRLSFSVSNGSLKFLLSSDITAESKILINRNVLDRAMDIAPFLSYDSDAYIVNADGYLYWIIDAMTTSNRYPYSQPNDSGEYNYIRNSVKVVVDAYNGDVTYYIIDESDPIAQVYSKIYPTLFKSASEMPAGIRSHLRYSEAYFNAQAKMYLTYHMSNASVFYNKEDAWSIATQYYQGTKEAASVNSAYMIMKLPDREEEFLLMVPFTAVTKDNMVAWMAGVCDGDEYGKLIVYEFDKQSLIYGPMQIEQRIDQDTTIAPQLALLGQQGSSVLRGNLLTIPIDNSLLYIEPIYVRATSGKMSLPEMKKVVISYKDTIVMADTLTQAIEQIFGSIGDVGSGTGSSSGTNTPMSPTASSAELIARANELFNLAQQALQGGDWNSYGSYMQQLGQILTQLGGGSSSTITEPTAPTTNTGDNAANNNNTNTTDNMGNTNNNTNNTSNN